jgi:hypothetical protein
VVIESEDEEREARDADATPKALPNIASHPRAAYKKSESERSIDLEGGARSPLPPRSKAFTFDDPVDEGAGKGVDSSAAQKIDKVITLHGEMKDISHFTDTKKLVVYDVIDS